MDHFTEIDEQNKKNNRKKLFNWIFTKFINKKNIEIKPKKVTHREYIIIEEKIGFV